MNSNADFSERQWLSALKAGDERALRSIFDRYYGLLLGDIHRIVADEDSCQDLAQEIFVDLWRKRDELDIHTSLRAYLRRAAVNRAINYLKTSRRFVSEDPGTLSQAPDSSPSDIQYKADQENLEKTLYAAIDTLPEKCRAIFALSRFEQLSHREIAEKLGISVKTIENQITKAMKILREALVKHSELSPAVIWAIKYWWMA